MKYSHRFVPLLSLAILLVCCMTCLAQQEKSNDTEQPRKTRKAFRTELRVTQINASISGDTSLTDDIGTRDEHGRPSAVTGPFSFFTLADLKIGDMTFHFDADGETWDEKRAPTNPTQASRQASPVILSLPGQEVTMSIGGVETFQYMRRVEADRFELATIDLSVGITAKLKLEQSRGGRVRLAPFKLTIASVQGRQPIEGVDLNIGVPLVSKQEAVNKLTLELGRPYGIQWMTDGQGVLLITLKVSEVDIPEKSDNN